jgi:homocysteine S-methyltransferase
MLHTYIIPSFFMNYSVCRWIHGEKCCPIENYVEEWLNLGVTYIGGCCQTYAADIVRIKEKVEKWRSEWNSKKNNGDV